MIRLIVAFRIPDQSAIDNMHRWLIQANDAGRLPFAVLIDGYQKGALGGTGKAPPWEMLAHFKPALPLILAGGLTPENVAEAVRIVRPYAVDVASGVESSPGKKDVDKIRRFIDNARSA
jgi:phosphoribosylanthranilate isomerase